MTDSDIQPNPYIDAMAAEHVQEYEPDFWPEHAHELNPPPQGGPVLDMLCRGGDHAGCVGPPGTTCECPCHAREGA